MLCVSVKDWSREKVKTSEFSEIHTDPDPDLLPQRETFDVKNKELHENRETKKKYEMLDAQRTPHEDILYEKSKKLALIFKDKANYEEIMKREFDLFWENLAMNIIRDTPPIRDIDIMRDLRKLLSGDESVSVDHWRQSRDIFTVQRYSDYVVFKKVTKSGTGGTQTLSRDDEAQIRSFVTDVVQQTDKMIQSFNILKMGYNISCIQQLTDYIRARVTEHEEGQVKYVFKNQFFMDVVLSICERANKMITDQHRLFREDNDPVINVEEKREEYYSIFQKYCHGSASAVIFGEIICQKLIEPIEQSLYKKTARDLADEIRCNCESLNGNRSNLEKHILKTLAAEEDFDKYMNYIHNTREHFKSFIRDEVSRYITDEFSVSVLPKMEENIKLLQQKIVNAVSHESTEHAQVNRGDVDLWLKSFTQELSDELVFSEKDLSGVNHDDVVDFNLLQDVIFKELCAIVCHIRSRFNTDTFLLKLDSKFRTDEILIDLFGQCCWAQCPFCKAVCTNTIANHDGDHSVPLHQVTGPNGWFHGGTKHFSLTFCTSAVASGRCFYSNGQNYSVPWREYRKAGGAYAKWSITPDSSELSYWKWFVCRFQIDLEKYYDKQFEGYGEIPNEWRKYSKQDALESLDRNM